YVQVLVSVGRFEDALLIANTALRMDPFNSSVASLVDQLKQMRDSAPQFAAARQILQQQEEEFRTNPANISNAITLAQTYVDNHLFNQATQVFASIAAQLEPQWRAAPTNPTIGSYLAAAYLQLRQPVRAQLVLNQLIQLTSVDHNTLIAAAQTYAQLNDGPHLEQTLRRLTEIAPNNPEAWYDYAGVLATLNKPAEALNALARAVALSDTRRASDPNARDLRSIAINDPRFQSLHAQPQWIQPMR